MEITITKTVQVSSAITYLKYWENIDRSDIKEYLESKKISNIPKPLNQYFKRLKILDKENNLTDIGKEVKNTGKLEEAFEGKFRIWYIRSSEIKSVFYQKDLFRGDVILYVVRERANEKSFDTDSEYLSVEKFYFAPTRDNKDGSIYRIDSYYSRLTINPLGGSEESIRLGLKISSNGKKLQGHITFEGNLTLSQNQNLYLIKKEIEDEYISDIVQTHILSDIGEGDWDEKNRCFRVTFNDDLDDDTKCSFKRNSKSNSNGDIVLKDVPVRPSTKEDAQKWLEYLLYKEIEKEYLSVEDINVLETSRKVEPPLCEFQDDLKSLDIEDLLSNSTTRENHPRFYWHLKAPQDLNPDKPFINPDKPFINPDRISINFSANETCSIEDLANQLKKGEKDIEWAFYYDRYVLNKNQQKIVGLFLEAIGAHKNVVMTKRSQMKHKDNGQYYLKLNNLSIEIEDIYESFDEAQKCKIPHKRTLSLKPKGKEIYHWEISAGLTALCPCSENKDVKLLSEEGFDAFRIEETQLNETIIKRIKEL